MHFRKPSSRWALWVFAVALLLKSAMPLLAHASAQMQGKTLVEVCTVYGVSMVPLDAGSGHQPDSDVASKHGNDHCALTALGAWADAEPSIDTVTPSSQRDVFSAHAFRSTHAPDACAEWVARLRHGPPTFG